MEKFAIVIPQEPTGWFWAEVPSLPGCYSQGETVDELKANIREAIEGVLDVLCAHRNEREPNLLVLDFTM